MRRVSYFLACGLSLFFCLTAGTANLHAATNPDNEVSFRYRIGSVNVDPKLNPNQDNLSKLDNLLSRNQAVQRIELRASSSPEGPYYLNERYAHERAEKMIQFLSERYPSLPSSVWQVEEVPEDWDGVADYLRRSTEDYKNEAMQIVRGNSPNRKELLQDLYAGEAWDDLYKYAFPWLRSVKLRVIYGEGVQPEKPEVADLPEGTIVTEGSIPVYFERSSSSLRQDFNGNAANIARIRQQVADGANALSLVAYASPEGTDAVNMAISRKRTAAVRDYLARLTGIQADKISVSEFGEDWEGFTKAVNATYYGSDREDVLNILRDRTMQPSAKEEALKKLDGGRTWQSLIQNQMTDLRRVEVRCLREETPQPEIPEIDETEVDIPEETLEVDEGEGNVQIEPTDIQVDQMEVPDNQPETPVTPPVVVPAPVSVYAKPIIGIYTNLLYDAVTAFNIGVDIPISEHWSITADAIYNNMSFSGGRKINLLVGEVGASYYFSSNRPPLTGWFASLGAGIGKYDLVGKEKGRKGTALYSNLGGGYTFQLGPETSPWRLKLAAGIGPFQTSFKYSVRSSSGEMVYVKDDSFTWQVPTNVQAILIYLFQTPVKSRDSK